MQSNAPLLKRTAKIKTRMPDRVVVEYLEREIILDGAGAELFGKIIPFLNGETSLGQIAERVGEKSHRVEALTDQLQQSGIVASTTARAETMTGLEFYELHRRYSSYWLRSVYEHPLWEKMIAGKASRAQVIGFAFEKYHYIEGAHEHMAVAAANATP